MNIIGKLFYNKPIKALFYLKGFARYYTPKWILEKKLRRKLSKIKNRPDYAYIQYRVDYYNKLSQPQATPAAFDSLKLHSYKSSKSAAYFFDTNQYTRWFSNTRRWKFLPGDIVEVPSIPSIVKSRPIKGDNQNAVLLKLNKIRHFVFLKDRIPFSQKKDKAIFRLTVSKKPGRIAFMEKFYNAPICEAGVLAENDPSIPKEWIRPKISLYDHLEYKFIVALEGIDVATNLKWIMSTNSIAVMPRPSYETWFMEGTLIPDYHYIEIKSDYSDLEEKLLYYIDHQEEAAQIIQNAHDYIEQFKDKKREDLISLMVLDKYFKNTGQTAVATKMIEEDVDDLPSGQGSSYIQPSMSH